MNNEQLAQEIANRVRAQQATSLKKANQDEDAKFGYNTKSAIVVMTTSQQQIGYIQAVSQEMKSLLHYKTQELKGQNVRILMPKILERNHDAFVENYFRTNQPKIMNKQQAVFAKTKEGFMVLVELLVKAIPLFQQDKAIFIGFLKAINSKHS